MEKFSILKRKIIMKTYFDKDYHERITLVTTIKNKKGNKSKHYFIHRLMMWEFVGPPPDEYHNVVNHKMEYRVVILFII